MSKRCWGQKASAIVPQAVLTHSADKHSFPPVSEIPNGKQTTDGAPTAAKHYVKTGGPSRRKFSLQYSQFFWQLVAIASIGLATNLVVKKLRMLPTCFMETNTSQNDTFNNIVLVIITAI